MNEITVRRSVFLILACLPLCVGQTCGVDTNIQVTPDPGTGTGSTAAEPAPPPATVTVQFINGSAQYALDVEFYVSATPVTNPATELFVAEKRVSTVGFAGTGLMAAGATDTVELPCAGAAVIGTKGGRFVNADTGAEIGRGVQRVAQVSWLYTCGDVFTVRYRPDGERFTTDLFVE